MTLVQFRVAASSAAPRLSLPKAWGWQSSKNGVTIPKSFGFEAATPDGATNNVTRSNRKQIILPTLRYNLHSQILEMLGGNHKKSDIYIVYH
jgi:hypothetical protein